MVLGKMGNGFMIMSKGKIAISVGNRNFSVDGIIGWNIYIFYFTTGLIWFECHFWHQVVRAPSRPQLHMCSK
jgi:hypothetical protein